jgi:hypothetical protein
VAENVAHNFDIGSGINLPACVAVTKGMGPDHLGGNTGKPCVVPDPVANGAAGYRFVRHIFPEKHKLN